MRDLTARRERLVNPLALLLLAGLFGLAFVLLLPAREAFRPDASGDGRVDAVDIAYLRARAASGESVADEASALATRLIEAGRPARARALLSAFPGARLDAPTAFVLELETAAAALSAATPATPMGAGADPALAAALADGLERLEREPALQSVAALRRGAWLSTRLDAPALSARLHAGIAALGVPDAHERWVECGRYAAAAGARALAIDCYRRGLDTLVGSGGDGVLLDAEALADAAFDLRLALLGQLGGEEDEVARSALVDVLLARETPDAGRLEALARALLGIERPGEAARVHSRLAELDPARRAHWWREAARWSEAAGRPDLAAAWLDRLAAVAAPRERQALQRRVEALLVAAGREREVLERVAARIEANPGDVATLRDGVRLARRGGDPVRADAWNEALLERAPDDGDALVTAIDLALARADLAAARGAAERAVHRRPDDRASRVRLAQIAEWSGDPEGATAQWRLLADTDPDGASLRELVRLARLTLQPGIAADAAYRLALLDAPGDAGIERLVELHELDGRPRDAADAVEAILDVHGATPAALATLARLHERHGALDAALNAWSRRAALAGDDVEGTLARVALHWRLNQRDAAGSIAALLRGRPLGTLDARTAELLSEIAWRDRRTWLARAVAPSFAAVDDPEARARHGRRLVASLRADGDLAGALAEADALWRATQDAGFAITAMNLAVESGDTERASAYLVADAMTARLGSVPAYWTAAAALRLSRDDVEAARGSLERALALAPEDVATLASLLWVLVDAGDSEALAALLDEHAERAVDEPGLWSVYALARLGLGEPTASLAWFERLSDRIGTDYALLLGYGDALEASGRVDDAGRLRRHAFAKLRPALIEALGTAAAGREALLREYVALASRHDGLDERWTGALLRSRAGGTDAEDTDANADAAESGERWREDVAIAWLLSTERQAHARLIMARLHAERASAPAWQALSVALAANDLPAITAVLDGGEPLSVADRILALRATGADTEAMAIAARAMRDDPSPATRDFAANRYAELRAARPSWAEGFARRSALGALETTETGVAARHTFGDGRIGLSLEALRSALASDTLDLDGRDARGDVALSLHLGGVRRALRLDVGIETDDTGERARGGLAGTLRSRDERRELTGELMLAERATGSPELAVGAVRDRASLYAESAFGLREYVRLQLDATELRARDTDERVARGVAGRAEIGVRGALGASAWSASVAAAHAGNDRAATLPAALALSADATRDTVLAPRTTSLALGGSIVHGGGVGSSFPLTGRPRWFADGSVDHDWPARSFGLRVNTGLGLRVLGGDELAFTLSHDTRAAGATGADGSTLGVGYRFHF